MTITFSRTWSSAHYYSQPIWSEEENRKRFGKCFSENGFGHGHDYVMEVSFKAPNQREIMQIEKHLNKLCELLDHKHLNKQIGHFKKIIPTTENIAEFCWHYLSGELRKTPPCKLCLFERPDLWVEVRN